jgi:hypothetical protein
VEDAKATDRVANAKPGYSATMASVRDTRAQRTELACDVAMYLVEVVKPAYLAYTVGARRGVAWSVGTRDVARSHADGAEAVSYALTHTTAGRFVCSIGGGGVTIDTAIEVSI